MLAVVKVVNNNVISYTIPAVLAALILLFFVIKYLLNPIPIITSQIQALAEGKANIDIIQSTRKDEIGVMQKAMLELKETVATSFRQAQVIENLPVPIITTDKEGACQVLFTNKSARSLADTIGKSTGLSSLNLKGSPIEKLDRDLPEISRNPSKQPFHKRVRLDGEVLDIHVNPLKNAEGEYIRAMIHIINQTQQEKLANIFETDVEGAIRNLNTALENMRKELKSVGVLAQENAKKSTTVAAAAEESGTNVHTVAAAVEELSASIKEISEQVSRSTKLTSGAVEMAQQAGEKANSLSTASQRIGDVLQMISEIAEQTNLLALNATIEAARAGDAGKGFAVVANEVKNLATETSKATSGVESEIQSVNNAVKEVVDAISSMAKTVEEINGIFTTVASSVEEQNIATSEITKNIQQASSGTQEVVSNIQVVNSASNQTGTAIQTIMGQADLLADESKNLDKAAKDFLVSVRKQ